MNPLTNAKNLHKLNLRELDLGLTGTSTSWHSKYKDSAWVHVGGLPYDLTEGDIICVFSQFGEIVNVNLVRDKDTGKSRGFCFICYEDQRSTILAVDNLNTAKLVDRTIKVDHVENYRVPKEFKDQDELTKKLHKEGCAPELQTHSPEMKSGMVKKEKKKDKKEKKKKKIKDEMASADTEIGSKKKKKKKKKKHSNDDVNECLNESQIKLEPHTTLLKRELSDDKTADKTGDSKIMTNEGRRRKDQDLPFSRNDCPVEQELSRMDGQRLERSHVYPAEEEDDRQVFGQEDRRLHEQKFNRHNDSHQNSGRNVRTTHRHVDQSTGNREDEQSDSRGVRRVGGHNQEGERRSYERDNQIASRSSDRHYGNERKVVTRGEDSKREIPSSSKQDNRPSLRDPADKDYVHSRGHVYEKDVYDRCVHRDHRNGDGRDAVDKDKYSGKHKRSSSDEDNHQSNKKRYTR